MGYWRSCLCSVLFSALVLAKGTSGQDITMTPSTVRLVNGDTNYGRLEVYYSGEWGTVCDDLIDDTVAMVVCRQLGLDAHTVSYYPSAHFGEGYGVIWLDEVSCNGSESSLFSCSHSSFGIHDCMHSEDVGISCGSVNVQGTSGGSAVSGIGSWLSIAVAVVVIIAAVSAYRRRRLNHYRRSQQTTCTTTVVQPQVTVSHPSNSGMPTYYHNAQQPGGTPAPPQAPAGPGSYPRQPQQPQQPYPQQPYPQQSHPQQPYPPPSANPYPPPSVGGAELPAVNPYPAQPYPPPTGATAPYPPAPAGADPPPMYPPQATSAANDDLPPPPAYTDVVKQ